MRKLLIATALSLLSLSNNGCAENKQEDALEKIQRLTEKHAIKSSQWSVENAISFDRSSGVLTISIVERKSNAAPVRVTGTVNSSRADVAQYIFEDRIEVILACKPRGSKCAEVVQDSNLAAPTSGIYGAVILPNRGAADELAHAYRTLLGLNKRLDGDKQEEAEKGR
jgi:hypothetical protein